MSKRRIELRVNGQSRSVVPCSLHLLLDELGYAVERRGIAVAVNGQIVPRGVWDTTALAAGDDVEIVGAVQGG